MWIGGIYARRSLIGFPKISRYVSLSTLGGLDPSLSPRAHVLGFRVWVNLDSHVEYTSFLHDGKCDGFVNSFVGSNLNQSTHFHEKEAQITRFT